MLTLTLTTPMTDAEAGAAAALLLTLNPDAVAAALEGLDRDQLRLPLQADYIDRLDAEALERGTPEQSPVAAAMAGPEVIAPPAPTAAEAFAPRAAGGDVAQPPEAGVPTSPPAPANAGPVVAPPPPAPPADGAPAPASNPAPSTGPAAPATGPAAAVELDSTGLPWDARIHATGKDGKGVLTAKGPWRAKRGLNQLTAHKIEAELRAALAAPGAPTAAPPPPPAETPAARTMREAVAEGLIPSPPAPAAATPPPPPAPAPVAAPPPPASAASAPPVSSPSPAPPVPSPAPSPLADDAPAPGALFAAAMRKVTAAQAAGHMTVEETNAVVAQLGLAAVRDLITRPDLLPTFEASVQLHVDRYAAS